MFTLARLTCLAVATLAGCSATQIPTIPHQDPLGFSVNLPQGWRVDTSTRDVILIRLDDNAWILVHPFLLRGQVSAGQWLARVPAAFEQLLPQARITQSAQRSRVPDEAVASLQFTAGGVPWRATLLCSIAGRGGMLYGIAAPSAQFAERRPLLVGTLRSFRFTQPGAGPGASGGLHFVRWQDPREGAFSIEVPQGWRVEGGMFRLSTVDIRGAMQMMSPDGQVRVIAGDPNIPTHTMPTQMLAMTGFPEGSWYSPGFNTRMLVRRFLTGLQFASEYTRRSLAAGCAGFRFTEQRELPEASRQLSGLFLNRPGLVTMQVHAGEVAFTCTANEQPMQGYLFSGTLLVPSQSGGIWQVPFLHGFLAAAPQTGTAVQALDRLIRSIQINPAWASRQQAAAGETSAIISKTHAYVSGVIEQGYWSREQARYESSRKFSNMILGQTDVVDPETGERWKVASGHNYYWRQDYTDNVAGTNISERPDTNFSPLLEY